MTDVYRALVENATDALSWHAPDGAFGYVSPGFTQLFGYRAEDVVGLRPDALIHPDDVQDVAAAHRDLLQGGRDSFRITFRIRRTDHTYLWVESTGRLAPGEQGADGMAVATRVIEVRRSLMEALEYEQRVLGQLGALAEQQQHFVTTVAHRARTPMTAVLGFAQTLHLHAGRLDDERRAYIAERLATSAEQLAGVIQDATDLDRAVRATAPLQREPCELPRLIDDALAQLADADADIEVDLDPEAKVVQADPTRLDRALRALLRNAIGHTPIRTPIAIRTRRSSDRIVITVEDRGPGVRDELKWTIFEPFTKGDSYLPHDPGLGLGLALVARIAAEHGGYAWVTDVEDGGAAFHMAIAG